MPNPNYTLYYFNGRGRAEICRMLMAAAGVNYTDKRFEFNEWDKYRNEMPCMTVPVLEMEGGNKMPETMAIARFLAKEHGFYGKNPMDMFKCDYIADCFYEIMHDYMRSYHWKNGRFRFGEKGMMGPEMDRAGDMSNFNQYLQWRYMNTFNRIMPFLEKTLEKQNGGSQFFLGDQMTWCDMMCYCCLENPYMEDQAMFSQYPKLMALRTRLAAHPKIAHYLKNRSNTNW